MLIVKYYHVSKLAELLGLWIFYPLSGCLFTIDWACLLVLYYQCDSTTKANTLPQDFCILAGLKLKNITTPRLILLTKDNIFNTLKQMKTQFQNIVGDQKLYDCMHTNSNENLIQGNTKNSDESNESAPMPAAL